MAGIVFPHQPLTRAHHFVVGISVLVSSTTTHPQAVALQLRHGGGVVSCEDGKVEFVDGSIVMYGSNFAVSTCRGGG